MKPTLLFATCLFSAFTYSQTIDLEEVATGFSNPIEIVHAGDERLFVVQQGGLIRILNDDGTVNATPFLNISSIISAGGERGLLGLAFHPDYANNGYFYVNYTNLSGNTVIARYSRNATDESLADASSQLILMTIDQPFPNHNGGCLRFGPDGYLYIAMGDGGSGGDPGNRAQNLETLLGKMLRVDVDNGAPYGIPASNPFVGTAGMDEIWAYGLRNPWKFSFNRDNGDIWIADVGQNAIEEINKAGATAAGLNYGWRCYEGTAEFDLSQCSTVGIYTMPLAQYTHASTGGCSITGGYVYTGDTYPAMQGKYIFSDYCSHKIGVLDTEGNISYTAAYPGNFFAAFGEDADGELYVAGKTSGTIYKIIDSSLDNRKFSAGTASLYPNPAENEVFVKLDQSATIKIFDTGGKLLSEVIGAEGDNRICISGLQAGIYIVTIKSEAMTNTQKLVVR